MFRLCLILTCVFCLFALPSLACGQAPVPQSVLGPLNQVGTDLSQQATDQTTKTVTAANLSAAQTADTAAASALATDATTVTNDVAALKAAIDAWVASGGAIAKPMKLLKKVAFTQSQCPSCPGYVPQALRVPEVAAAAPCGCASDESGEKTRREPVRKLWHRWRARRGK